MAAEDLASAINANLTSLKGGSLSFWGYWLGRPYDDYSQVFRATSDRDFVEILFQDTKKLRLEAPQAWSLFDDRLVVGDAKYARLEWAIGRKPQLEPQFLDFRHSDSGIELRSNRQFGVMRRLDPDLNAFEIHPHL